MSRDKQIEEMALEMASEARTCLVKVECKNCGVYLTDACKLVKYAKRFAELGYRKASDGEWIFRNDGAYGRTRCYCSACGKHSGIGGIRENQLKPFCPNCGAKMVNCHKKYESEGADDEQIC